MVVVLLSVLLPGLWIPQADTLVLARRGKQMPTRRPGYAPGPSGVRLNRSRHIARFDLLNQELVRQELSIYRRLHCWDFSFNWNPAGPGQGFMLRINVRNEDLRDIKFETKKGRWNLPF